MTKNNKTSPAVITKSGYLQHFEEIKAPRIIVVIKNILAFFVVGITLMLTVTPWVQVSQGIGNVTALDPHYRVQSINSLVGGRINKWYVKDGDRVSTGDTILEIVDNDPKLLDRLTEERDSIRNRHQFARIAAETGLLNYKRQEELFASGLSSRKEYEKSKIDYKKLLNEEAMAAAHLAQVEVKLSRQRTQVIKAPKDGVIMSVVASGTSVLVKEGDHVATFVPDVKDRIAEIFVDGNDINLIHVGRKARLQFEGWPAVQFSGWPSVAIGTFGGVVKIVDSSASKGGKFRVIIEQDKADMPWPDEKHLRQGTRVHAWIILNKVKLGYELWRRLNGFPAALDEEPSHQYHNSNNDTQKASQNNQNIHKKAADTTIIGHENK